MTHFETLLVESVRDLAKQVQQNNELCVRLDERSEGFERRLEELEKTAKAVACAAPPSSRRGWRVEPREAVIASTALVALVTSIVQALSPTPPPPALPPQTPHASAEIRSTP